MFLRAETRTWVRANKNLKHSITIAAGHLPKIIISAGINENASESHKESDAMCRLEANLSPHSKLGSRHYKRSPSLVKLGTTNTATSLYSLKSYILFSLDEICNPCYSHQPS
jgi:hypothetical protein